MSGYIKGYRNKSLDGRYIISITNKGSVLPLAYKTEASSSYFHLFNVPSNKSFSFLLEADFDLLFPESMDIEINQVGQYCKFDFEVLNESAIPVFPGDSVQYIFDTNKNLGETAGITNLANEGALTPATHPSTGEPCYRFNNDSLGLWKLDDLDVEENFKINVNINGAGDWTIGLFANLHWDGSPNYDGAEELKEEAYTLVNNMQYSDHRFRIHNEHLDNRTLYQTLLPNPSGFRDLYIIRENEMITFGLNWGSDKVEKTYSWGTVKDGNTGLWCYPNGATGVYLNEITWEKL